MKRVAIVFHGGYGRTAKLAQAVADGAAKVPGTQAQLVRTEDTDKRRHGPEVADPIVFGAPTCIGGPSAAFKNFMEQCSNVWV